MTPLPRALVLVGLASTLLASPASAQTTSSAPGPAAPTLSLAAYGETRAAPDMASISLGVETADPTAAGAMSANAGKMARVIAALKRAAIADRDLMTSGLSLAPQYVYEQNQPPRLTGYQASNQLTVTVRDLARLGPVADAVVTAGATNVGQIAFALANPRAAEDTARLAAVKAMDDKAALYARATGYRLGRLVRLSEGADVSPGPRPLYSMMAARADTAQRTPVETGELTVRIDINAVFELER